MNDTPASTRGDVTFVDLRLQHYKYHTIRFYTECCLRTFEIVKGELTFCISPLSTTQADRVPQFASSAGCSGRCRKHNDGGKWHQESRAIGTVQKSGKLKTVEWNRIAKLNVIKLRDFTSCS